MTFSRTALASFTALSFAALSLAACLDDDDADRPPTEAIVRTWALTSYAPSPSVQDTALPGNVTWRFTADSLTVIATADSLPRLPFGLDAGTYGYTVTDERLSLPGLSAAYTFPNADALNVTDNFSNSGASAGFIAVN